ncbi:MAG: hypothetical protein NUV51_12265 [Sulfuricaulis sp.]|nr:hypothetical protein [Sulfuricaulis sp.]
MYRYFLTSMLVLMVSGCASLTSTSGRAVIKDDTSVVDIRISERDRSVIERYYGHSLKQGKGLSPGLAKRDKLPPGLRGETLPQDLEEKLSRLPSTHVRLRIGQDIILMDRLTRVIVDVVYGIAH